MKSNRDNLASCPDCGVPGTPGSLPGVTPKTIRCGNCGSASGYRPTVWEILVEDLCDGEWFFKPLYRTPKPTPEPPAVPKSLAARRIEFLDQLPLKVLVQLVRVHPNFYWSDDNRWPIRVPVHVRDTQPERDFFHFTKAELKAACAKRVHIPRWLDRRSDRKAMAKRQHGMGKSKNR